MDKRHSAVFGRHFSFIGVFAILILCLVFLGACDSKDVSGLFTPSSEFQVTFVLNNGEDNIVWHRGDVVPSPTKENFKFVGWCNDAALNSLTNPDFESLSLSQNLVLYAKWEELPDITGVIFEDVDVVYDGQAHTLEVQNLPSGATVVYDVENSYTNVGKYTINALISLEGYKDLSLSATLTIEKAVVSGISFEDKAADWDGGVHAIEVEGNLPSGVSVEYFGNKQSEVGQYKVVARFSVSDNYEPIEDMSATLTINEVYFLVSFVNGNGNVYAESVAHGCGVRRIPELYQKDGYTASWQKIDTTSVYEDLTINAEYTPITYTISFVSVGDVVNEIEYNIEKGVDFATWQRDCYTFDGWYTDALCTSKRIDGIGEGNIGDKTYYAKWIPVEYTVRYHLNGGLNSKQNVNSGEEYIYTVESSRLVLEDPSKSHYVFEGWFANANFTGMKWEYLPKGASGNRDFYAKWAPETYSVEYRLGGGINDEENPSGYNYESSCITLLPATREHYDFVCWCNEKNEVVTTLADGKYGDVVLIARWKAIEHTIYLCEDNGTIFDKIIYTIESEDIKLEEQLKPYYNFIGWYDKSGNKVETISAKTAEDVYVYTKFTPKDFSIIYAYNGGNVVNNPTTYTIEDEDITLIDSSRDYYTFLGWYNGNEKVEIIKKGSHGNIELHARWKAIEYSVSYHGVENISGYVRKYSVESNNIVLPSPNKDYYIFDGWYLRQDFSGNAITQIDTQNPQNYSLYAKFTPIKYHISYNLNGGSEVQNPTGYTVEDDEITLIEPIKDNYVFLGWYSDSQKVVTINKGSHEDFTLVAKWQAVEYTVYLCDEKGACFDKIVYTIESDDVVLKNQLKEYYDFVGWFNEDGNKIATISASTAKDVYVYTKFKAKEFEIKYAYNGGENVNNPTTYTIEDEDITLIDSSRDYYTFLGWYKGSEKVEVIAKGSHGNITLEAKWQANEYSIAYHGVVDTAKYITSFTVESENIVLPTPHRDYYNFAGWYTSQDLGTKIVEIDTKNPQNYNLYAKFTAIEYRISYVLNGGSNVQNPTSYTVEGDEITLIEPTKDNYVFLGWYNGNEKVERIFKGSHENITLEAKWKAIEYAVYLCDEDGLIFDRIVYTVESNDIKLENQLKEYYDFVGWFDKDDNKIATIPANTAKDVYVYTKFKAKVYTITYAYNGGGDVDNPTTYTIEDEDITLIEPSRDYYTFLGWYSGSEKVERILKGSHGAITLKAKWQAVEYSITYHGVENTSDYVKSYTVESESITLPVLDRDYYTFDGWYASSEFDGKAISEINTSNPQNYNLYAKFTAIEYHISYDYNGGSVVGNPTSYTVEDNNIQLLNPTRKHYNFMGWFNGGEKVEIINTNSPINITLHAKWQAVEYVIAYYGVDNTDSYVTSYTVESENITLPIPHKDYYDFGGWYLSQNFSNDAIVEINTSNPQNYSLYAKFTAIEYHISYNYNGGSEVNNPKEYTFESDTITLLAPIKDNYTFVGWYNQDTRIQSIAKGSHGDLSLEARWSSDVHTITYRNVEDTSDYPKTYSIESGDVTLPTPIKNYYNFIGWYENADFSGEKVAVIKANDTKDYVLYPRFAPIEYVISYSYNGGLDAQNPTIYTVESDRILLKGTSKAHYNFVGWYSGDDKVESIESGSHGNMRLEARFEAIEYSITYHNVENISSFIATYTIEDGDIILQKPQKDYYNFVGWYLSADFSGDTVEKVNVSKNGNAVVYALFTPISYSITYDLSSGVSNSNKTSYTVEDSDFVLLDVEKRGYNFIGWYDSQTNEKVEVVTTADASNRRFYAKFSAIEYTITYEGASGLANDNRVSYTVEDSDFALLDVEKRGYNFIGWYDSQTNEKVEAVTTADARNYRFYAKFSAIEYTITYDLSSGVSNSNKTSYTIEDSNFTLLDVAQDGFEFLGWYDSETDEKVSIIDTSFAKNITLVAKWNKLPSSIPTTPFDVDENGCLTGIDANLLDSQYIIKVPSSVDGVSVNSIGSGAFASIKDTATQIEIAEGIEEIASDLFDGMSKLEKLVLPSTITTMYKGMLAGCVSLCDVTVPFASFWTSEIGGASATKYLNNTSRGYVYNFMYLFATPEDTSNYTAVSVQQVALDTSTIGMAGTAYIPNALTQVTVHGGDICAKSFCEINTLESITLGSEVSYIGNMAFAKNSGIKEIVIEGSAVTFGTGVFAKSDNLTTVYVANSEVEKDVDVLISGSTQCKLIGEK